jgi:hypothetical protein
MRQLELYIPTSKGDKRYTRAVPTEWNELSRKQLLKCMRWLFGVKDKYIKQRLLLQNLLQLPTMVFEALTPEQVALDLMPLISFLTEKNTLTKQLLPVARLSFRGFFKRLYGPKDKLRNLTFAEFIFADSYFIYYCKTGQEELLHKMIAVLYRERRYLHELRSFFGFDSGDIRTPFNEHLVGKRAGKVALLPDEVKLAILTWYRGCREALEAEYGYVFSQESDSRSGGRSGWEPVARGMSGKIFGDLNNTLQVSIHTVLAEMDDQLRADEKIKSKSNHTY